MIVHGRHFPRRYLLNPDMENYTSEEWYEHIKKMPDTLTRAKCYSIIWWNFIADRLPHDKEKWQKEMNKYNPRKIVKSKTWKKYLLQLSISPFI